MKHVLTILFASFLFSNLLSQTLPAVDVKDIKGNTVSTGNFSNNGKPIIISFWATWCKPCIAELAAIAENYPDWVEETGVKLIAVSIDDARNVAKVEPFVNGKAWEYEVYTDENGNFKRAMSVNNVPHTFILDGKGNIVWQINTYTPGGEGEFLEIVKKILKGEKIEQH